MSTENENMVQGVGQEGSTKDATEAYDKKAGSYAPSHVQGAPIMSPQPPSQVSPFGNVRGGK